MKRLSLIALLCLALSSCSYDGSYRYPCQDPANWDSADCKPPICTASDTCTSNMIPEEITDASVSTSAP
jgi:hypothetical protein